MTLDGDNRAVGVGDSLALCNLADHALTGLREGDDGRGRARALCVCDNGRFAALHDGDATVRGT